MLTDVRRAMLLRLFDDTSDVTDSTNKNSHVFRDQVAKDAEMAEAGSVEEDLEEALEEAADAPSPSDD